MIEQVIKINSVLIDRFCYFKFTEFIYNLINQQNKLIIRITNDLFIIKFIIKLNLFIFNNAAGNFKYFLCCLNFLLS